MDGWTNRWVDEWKDGRMQRRQSVSKFGGRESGRRNFRFQPIFQAKNSDDLLFLWSINKIVFSP